LVCPINNGNGNRYMQVGSVAWGIGCNDAIPGVYVNIPLFREWIDQNVRRYGFDPQVYSF
jgi:plasma kallikrein